MISRVSDCVHVILGLVIEQGIVEDQIHGTGEILLGNDHVVLDILLNGSKVHGILDDVEVIGNVQLLGVDRSQEGERVAVVLE